MALGRKERNRIKNLSTLPAPPVVIQRAERPLRVTAPASALFSSQGASAAFQQDYARCQQTELCAESQVLPDLDTMRDRMSLIAYDSNLRRGADNNAANVLMIALEVSCVAGSA